MLHLQWGTLDFHKRSLRNLNDAMRKTRKLCAVMLDTVGREITVKREVQIDEMGWPVHDGAMSVGAGQKVGFVAVGVSWACLTVPPQAARVMICTKEGGLCTAREPHEHLRCPEGGGVHKPQFVLYAAVSRFASPLFHTSKGRYWGPCLCACLGLSLPEPGCTLQGL